MKLYLVRHPEPQGIKGLCYGRLDVSVTSAASDLAIAKVRECVPSSVLRNAPIYTSPLSRCARFAGTLAAPRIPEIAPELGELHFGAWEGRAWNEVPRQELDDWSRNLWTYRPGGGESAQMLAARFRAWLDRVFRSPPDAAIAVTHAGVIRVALALSGASSLDDGSRSAIEFGSVHCIDSAHCARPAPFACEMPA